MFAQEPPPNFDVEAWRTWRRSYPGDYLDRIERKWLELVEPGRKPAFFVGNQQSIAAASGVPTMPPAPAPAHR